MALEDDFLDVLQNIEFAIITEFRKDKSINDLDARDAIAPLIRHYEAEIESRRASNIPMNSRAQRILVSVKSMCEWRLGRSGGPKEPAENEEPIDAPSEPLTLAEVVPCLKKIRSSIEFWTKERGTRGYLQFVAEYVK